MHDIKDLEGRGVVSVGIATSEFVDAAAMQNKYLGYDPAVIFVDHPIQDRTSEELRTLANVAFESIIKAVTA
ncbi:MAG: hypothetical protein HQ514_00765 [Rhodospirillales bacterium]|nr:hypothetical protein [Rhodospirillales bacterium]